DRRQPRGRGGGLLYLPPLALRQRLQPGGVALDDGPPPRLGGLVAFVQVAVQLPQPLLLRRRQGVERLQVTLQPLVVVRVGAPLLQQPLVPLQALAVRGRARAGDHAAAQDHRQPPGTTHDCHSAQGPVLSSPNRSACSRPLKNSTSSIWSYCRLFSISRRSRTSSASPGS